MEEQNFALQERKNVARMRKYRWTIQEKQGKHSYSNFIWNRGTHVLIWPSKIYTTYVSKSNWRKYRRAFKLFLGWPRTRREKKKLQTQDNLPNAAKYFSVWGRLSTFIMYWEMFTLLCSVLSCQQFREKINYSRWYLLFFFVPICNVNSDEWTEWQAHVGVPQWNSYTALTYAVRSAALLVYLVGEIYWHENNINA